MKATLNQLVDQMLDAPAADLLLYKSRVDQLVGHLCQVTGLELHPDLFLDEDATETAQGKAVSMTTAAQCAEEFMRTQVFLRGVYQAIQDQLQQQDTVHLLYAGTGPFGLLVVPLLHRFQPEQVRITLLDIHEQSLSALQGLIQALEVADYIERIECIDILQWPLPPQPCFDLIISETMKAMLEQEPQVAIFSHLVPALKETGRLIPEAIQIKAWLSAAGNKAHEDIYLADIFTLSQETAVLLNQGEEGCLSGKVSIPEYPAVYHDLKFTTDIQVYDQHWLNTGHCSLNLAKRIVDARPEPGTELLYGYQLGRYPQFKFDYISQKQDLDSLLPSVAEYSDRGIPVIKRIWCTGQLLNHGGELAKEVLAKEFSLYIDVSKILDKSIADILSLATTDIGLEEFEEYLLESSSGYDTVKEKLVRLIDQERVIGEAS